MDLWARVLRIAAAVAVFAILVSPAPCAELSGFERVAAADVPMTGREVALQVPEGARPRELRAVLAGSFKCSYNGRTYDALFSSIGEGPGQPHSFVRWSPAEMEVMAENRAAHRYVLRLPEGAGTPASVSAWVDVDGFVTEFIITPSEVRQSLSGNLRLQLWRASPQGPPPWLIIGGIVGIAALGLGAFGLWRQARRRMADVRELLGRIERSYTTAMDSVRESDWDTGEHERQLRHLRDGARELAERIGGFRRVAGRIDRDRLDDEIAQTQARLQEAERDDVRQELRSVLDARRRLREAVEDTEAAEQRYLLRLSRIDSTLEATSLWVTEQDGRFADRGEDRSAIEALKQELRAVDGAIEELKILERPETYAPKQ